MSLHEMIVFVTAFCWAGYRFALDTKRFFAMLEARKRYREMVRTRTYIEEHEKRKKALSLKGVMLLNKGVSVVPVRNYDGGRDVSCIIHSNSILTANEMRTLKGRPIHVNPVGVWCDSKI